jgi:hypothetical protein
MSIFINLFLFFADKIENDFWKSYYFTLQIQQNKCSWFTLTFLRIICFENQGQIEREEDKCEQVQIMLQISDYKGSVTDQYADTSTNTSTSISKGSSSKDEHKRAKYFL